tara:strand:+ start:860 stop:1708 length:849 start_codon:yes stop_codon:yes gene_type:complete
MNSNKIILGTAQFGQKYGVTNTNIVTYSEIKKIISTCKKNKIKFIDTAQGYGNSEKILGSLSLNKIKIITKIKIGTKTNIEKQINISRKKLRLKKLYCVLIHNCESLLKKNGHDLFRKLFDLKKRNLISRIGISIYDPKEFIKLKKKGYRFDIIQIPYSIFDKRFSRNNILEDMKKTGAEIHARSIFLQGLLLENKKIPIKFKKWSTVWNKWNSFINKNNYKRSNVCLSFVLANRYIDKIILGFSSNKEIKEIFLNFKKINFKLIDKNFTNDIKLINPNYWK